MKIFKIFFVFIQLFITSTISGETFNDHINKSYEKYFYVYDQETSFGDCALVYGKYKDNYYLCCYLLEQNVATKTYLRIKLDGNITTYVPDSNIVEGYGLKVKNIEKIEFFTFSNEQEVLINEYFVSDLNAKLENEGITGLNQGNFPKNKKETSLINKIIIYIIVFSLISMSLIVALSILYVKRVGKFKKISSFDESHQNIIDASYEYDDMNNDNVNYSTSDEEKIDNTPKEEIMERLFKEFRSGDISEEELNERLKNLWWHDK